MFCVYAKKGAAAAGILHKIGCPSAVVKFSHHFHNNLPIEITYIYA